MASGVLREKHHLALPLLMGIIISNISNNGRKDGRMEGRSGVTCQEGGKRERERERGKKQKQRIDMTKAFSTLNRHPFKTTGLTIEAALSALIVFIFLRFQTNTFTHREQFPSLHRMVSLHQPHAECVPFHTAESLAAEDICNFQILKNSVFWDVTPCGSCKNRRFAES
jgi:hypothetical protein